MLGYRFKPETFFACYVRLKKTKDVKDFNFIMLNCKLKAMFLKNINQIPLQTSGKYFPKFRSRNVVRIDDETAKVQPGDIINVYGIGPCRGGVIKGVSTYIPFHHARSDNPDSTIDLIRDLCAANGVDMPTAKKIIAGDAPPLQGEFKLMDENHSYSEELEILRRDRSELIRMLEQLNCSPGEIEYYFPDLTGPESEMNCSFNVIADTSTDDIAVVRFIVEESDSSLVAVGSLADSEKTIKAKVLRRIIELASYAIN